jgi:hypothetical protein
MARRASLLTVVLLLPLTAHAASSLGKPFIACLSGLNGAGARVGAAVTRQLLQCMRDGARGRLLAGETAEACLGTDPTGRIAGSRSRTQSVFARRCSNPPTFGPTSPDAVNAAFAAPLRIHEVFGPNLDAALIDARTDLQGAACQAVVARSMARIALAKVVAFNACARQGCRKGTISSAADLEGCIGADTGQRVTHALATAQALVKRKCAQVSIATAFPGECATAPLSGLIACTEGHVECGVCLAVTSADGLPPACSHYVDGVAAPYCGDRPVTTQSVARQWDE